VGEGELVQPAQVVVMLGDLGRLRAETEDLSEVDVSRIQVGQQAAVTVDALDGQVLAGTVYRVAPVATERRGDTVYQVIVELDAAPDGSLRWGMSAFVEIDTATQPEAMSAAATRLALAGSPPEATPLAATATQVPPPSPAATAVPTMVPTLVPSPIPSLTPTSAPTNSPTTAPTKAPSATPTRAPTVTPTPVPTNTPTSTPTRTPTRTATPTPGGTSTPRPTRRPAKTATPAPYLPAPGLVSPSDGATFYRSDWVLLEWYAVPGMPADAFYAIAVSYQHQGNTWYDDIPWTKETSWLMNDHAYLVDLSDDTLFHWSVQVMRKTGEDPNGKPIGIPLSPSSFASRLFWLRSNHGGGNTPPPPTP
jgi:hypothetical protein